MPSFSGGEIGEHLLGRTDTAKYQTALRRMRNCLPMVGGGFYNRPGFRWAGEVKDSTRAAWLIPWQFSVSQGYALEFGHETMRVVFDGAYVTEYELIVTNITNADPAQVTAPDHGYTTGEEVYFSNIEGMTEINGRSALVTVLDADNFTLDDVDSTTWGAFTGSGGGIAGDANGGEGGYPVGGPSALITTLPPFEDYETPDLETLIQQFIQTYGYQPPSHMVDFMDNNGRLPAFEDF